MIADYKNGKKVINYVNYENYATNDSIPTNTQVIQFGKNLLSLNRSLKGEEIATAIIPLGATVNSKETDNGTVDYKLDITNENDFTEGNIKHIKGTDYIIDEEAEALYGRIFKVINYDDIEDYYKDGYAVMDITFDEGDSSDITHNAIDEIENLIINEMESR